MQIRRLRKAVVAVTLVALAACGSDSTGPGDVTSEEALSSLARAFSGGSAVKLPFGMSPTVLGNAGSLGQIEVTIDGAAHTMFALGSRVTYPSGTCFESLFVNPPVTFPPEACTPPPLGLVLVLWQTRSGSRPPERMVFLSADVGTVDFGLELSVPHSEGDAAPVIFTFPAFGFYVNDREEFWVSVGGSLTSQVAATSESCAVTPPPFAKSSTCHVATFDESGRIAFERFDVFTQGTGTVTGQTMELVIPRQTILGIVQAITEISPITFTIP